jgi:hypothetical protein
MQDNYKFIYHTFLRATDNALHLLQKGKDYCIDKNIPEAEFLESKLISDMFDLKKQVQIFSDNVLGAVYRIVGKEKPSMKDEEKSFDDLVDRLEKTKKLLLEVSPEKDKVPVDLKVRLGWMPEGTYFDGHAYVHDYVMQNTFFHLVTMYAIMRHKGVPIGKVDYMGNIEMK